MDRFYIITNLKKDPDYTFTNKLKGFLALNGKECIQIPPQAYENRKRLPIEFDPDKDCVIVIGGDGTILSVVRRLRDRGVPLLGINLGTKGFMANVEPEEIGQILKAARGEYRLSRRMMLETELWRDGKLICRDHALNDVVLHGYGDCIGMTTWCDGQRVSHFSGDGIIVSTPTGSTGYSMSAGGPIVEPEAENIIISPICPHVMGARSFVLDPQRTVQVTAERLHGRRAYLAVDGNSVADLQGGDQVLVRRSPHVTAMADLGLKSFYEIAYEKLI